MVKQASLVLLLLLIGDFDGVCCTFPLLPPFTCTQRFQQRLEDDHKTGQLRARQEEEARQVAERKAKNEEYQRWLEEEKRQRLQKQCEAKVSQERGQCVMLEKGGKLTYMQ